MTNQFPLAFDPLPQIRFGAHGFFFTAFNCADNKRMVLQFWPWPRTLFHDNDNWENGQ